LHTPETSSFYENYIKETKYPDCWEQAFQKQILVDRYIVRSMMEKPAEQESFRTAT